MISVVEIADAGITIIEPGSHLTLENASELTRIVHGILSTFTPAVIIDLTQTTMLDSTGIGALVTSVKHIKAVNGIFALVGLRPEIQRTFHLMNLYQVFDVFDTQALARKQITAQKK